MTRIVRLAVILAAVLCLVGCASSSSLRHRGTVAIVATHSVLTTIDDSEMLLVCGRPGAPQAPLCVPVDTHRRISAMLAQAFGLEAQVARIIRALPAGAELPADVYTLSAQIAGLINAVVDLLPASKEKRALLQRTGLEKVR